MSFIETVVYHGYLKFRSGAFDIRLVVYHGTVRFSCTFDVFRSVVSFISISCICYFFRSVVFDIRSVLCFFYQLYI